MNAARSLSTPSEASLTDIPSSPAQAPMRLVWGLDSERGDFFASHDLCLLWQADPQVGISDYLSFLAGLSDDSQASLQRGIEQLLRQQRAVPIVLMLRRAGASDIFACTLQLLLHAGRSPLVQGDMSLCGEKAGRSLAESEAQLFRLQVERLSQLWFDSVLSPEAQLEKALAQAAEYLQMDWGRITSWTLQGERCICAWQTVPQSEHPPAWYTQFEPAGTLLAWGLKLPPDLYPFGNPAVLPPRAGLALSFEVAADELGILEWGSAATQGLALSEYQLQFLLMLSAWIGYLLQRERDLSRLKGLNASQERLLSMLAHDVRNAMSSVLGGSHLLRRRQLVSKEGYEVLDFVQRAGQHILRLLQEVLAMSELELRDGQRGFGSFDVNRQAQDTLAKWAVQAHEHQVSLNYELSEQPLRIRLHPAWFEQLLDNLLSNAIKFTPTGGQIHFQAYAEAQQVIMTVKDSGIGIPLDMHEDLFVRFTPSRRSGLRGEKSTGLGMYLMQQIVLLHGGHLQLESQENQGTCLTLSFPADSGQEAQA